MIRTWSARNAAVTAGVTRALVRKAVDSGLVPETDLDLADLVNLKANSFVRGIVFPGEKRPAAQTREPVLDRERQLATAVRFIVDGDHRDACVLFHQTHVTRAMNLEALNAQVTAATTTGEPYLVLPIGAWLTAIADG